MELVGGCRPHWRLVDGLTLCSKVEDPWTPCSSSAENQVGQRRHACGGSSSLGTIGKGARVLWFQGSLPERPQRSYVDLIMESLEDGLKLRRFEFATALLHVAGTGLLRVASEREGPAWQRFSGAHPRFGHV